MTSPVPPLDRETRLLTPALSLLGACAGSGLLSHHAPDAAWQQWAVLLHALTGIGLTLVAMGYLVTHFRRTVGVRRPGVLLSGVLAAGVGGALAGSGWWMLLHGQEEARRGVFDAHAWLAYAVLALTALHVLAHRLVRRPGRPRPAPFLSSSGPRVARAVAVALALLALVPLASAIYDASWPRPGNAPAVHPYEYSYGPHPFRPSETEIRGGGFVPVSAVGESRQCSRCHEQIYREWQGSMHAKAASDRAYVSNINLLADRKGIAATRYCEGCHAPVALLTGELTPGGRHGGIGGTPGNVEGVSCMSCHGIARVIHVKGVASYEFAAAREYLFARASHPVLRALHDFLVRVHPARHRMDMARPVLSTARLCATCHAQFMPEVMNGWGWVKLQDDYAAWLSSEFSGQSEHAFAASSAMRCQDCHQPRVAGRDPSADPAGRVVSHRFLGANTAIPFHDGDDEQLSLTTRFLRASKVRVAIDEPTRVDPVRSARYVTGEARVDTHAPFVAYLGERVAVQVTVTNSGVGHDFPGGTIDINEAWVWVRVSDAQNRTVFESGSLSAAGDVDEDAHFYRQIPIDRDGNVVWRHDLFNMVGESYRKTIPAGGSDVVRYEFEVPPWAKTPLNVAAAVKYRKLNARYARWALDDPRIALPVVTMAGDTLEFALRAKPPVAVPPAGEARVSEFFTPPRAAVRPASEYRPSTR